MEVLRKVKFNGGGATHRLNKGFSAFTLAEMMVVMLIMSIVLAAMAPVMTTKNKVDNSSPWRYSPNNSSDAYFGQGASMRAMIGQLNGEDTDNGKLIINNLGSSFSHILFKNGNTILGDLYMSGNNLILGHRNGSSTSLGQNNINIGPNNWPSTDITGQSNIIIGDNAMTHLSTGSNNIGLGTTLTALTTGTGNVTIGDNSLTSVTTGDGNIGLGNEANPAITTASKTIAIGTNSVASSNGAIAIGSSMTQSEGHGAALDAAQARVINSIAIGNNATSGANNGAGQNSIAIGNQAKANSTSDSGASGIAIGAYSNAGDHSVALGTSALKSNTTGSDNIAVGTSALKSNTTGSVNTALGDSALLSNTTGGHNISIGYAAMQHNDTGSYNIAIGDYALSASNTGSNNIAIGREAMYFQTNINTGNTAVGAQAMAGTSKASNYYNTAIGYQALHSAGNTSHNAGHNTAVGAEALYNNITGNYNTSIGSGACQYVTGSNKTCIGAFSGPTSGSDWASDDKEHIFIGSRSKFNNGPAVLEVHNDYASVRNVRATGRGKGDQTYEIKKTGVVVNGNLFVKGMIFFNDGTDDWANPGTIKYNGKNDGYGAQAYGREITQNADLIYYSDYAGKVVHQRQDSDRRLKYVGKDNNDGLAKIKQLKVFNYVYKKDTTKTPHVGVIAQDLQKVFPNAVKKGTDGFLTIRMEDMFYAVINAIKELDAKITALQKENQELKQLVKQVQEDNKRLDQRLQKLEAKQK
ncbi:hypothetical protein BHV42_07520 [Candidatus Melainabacteria bacterium MEL.A1]|nr:hypothetical protein BHV42_07520 [Candidatus Melainabacteria bacterium MEL.A1]